MTKLLAALCLTVAAQASFAQDIGNRAGAIIGIVIERLVAPSHSIRSAHQLVPRRDRKTFEEDRFGALFAGTAFALRRSVFMEVGEFWEDLNLYFGEDTDLSYRLLDHGYDILQTPFIQVCHFTSPVERHKSRRLYFGTRNAPWLALKNLPWYSVFGLTLLSWGYFFLIAVYECQMITYCTAIAASIRHMPEVYRIRKRISRQTEGLVWRYSGLIVF